jgi:hypothetical protein
VAWCQGPAATCRWNVTHTCTSNSRARQKHSSRLVLVEWLLRLAFCSCHEGDTNTTKRVQPCHNASHVHATSSRMVDNIRSTRNNTTSGAHSCICTTRLAAVSGCRKRRAADSLHHTSKVTSSFWYWSSLSNDHRVLVVTTRTTDEGAKGDLTNS